MPKSTVGYAVADKNASFGPWSYPIRDCRDKDVHIKVTYCGICHSDIHQTRGDWGGMLYPMVPGHEVIGVVSEVGKGVTKVKVGDRVGVGCFVDSCRSCLHCKGDQEQYCPKHVLSYNGKDYDGNTTYGGYGKDMVVDEHFVLKVPSKFSDEQLKFVAPLLCAGITTWSPLKDYEVDKPRLDGSKKKVLILGVGGLGHVAIMLSKALGGYTIACSRTDSKRKLAMELGADEYVAANNADAMSKLNDIDIILDTVPVNKDIGPFIQMLGVGGAYIVIALPEQQVTYSLTPALLLLHKKKVVGSLVGGIKATQDMLDFCASHKILPKCEFITGEELDKAYERVIAGDVQFRFVIDHAKSKF